jgi:hypothetical protein
MPYGNDGVWINANNSGFDDDFGSGSESYWDTMGARALNDSTVSGIYRNAPGFGRKPDQNELDSAFASGQTPVDLATELRERNLQTGKAEPETGTDTEKEKPTPTTTIPTPTPNNPDGTPNTQYVDTYRNERERVAPYAGYNYTAQAPDAYQSQYVAPTLQQANLNPYTSGYVAPTFSEFARPDFTTLNDPKMELVAQLINNPHTLNAQNVEMMKEREKERALSMQEQLMGAGRSDATRRGINYAPTERRNAADLIAQLTGAYRDVDLAKSDRDRSDELNALTTVEQIMSGQFGRDQSAYQTQLGAEQAQNAAMQQAEQFQQAASSSALQHGQFTLAEQLAQEELRRFEEQFRWQENASQFQNAQFDLNRQNLEQQDLWSQWQAGATGTQEWNNTSAIAAQLAQQSLSQQLAMKQFLESQRQFNAGQNNQFSLAEFLANQWKQ